MSGLSKSLLNILLFAVLLGYSFPALAHIEVLPKEVGPGEYARLVFFVYHGCDSAPTSALTVRIPDGVAIARPGMKGDWKITTESVEYPKPVEVYGTAYKGGFNVLTWSGRTIPAEFMDSFTLSAFFPNTPGKTLRFLVEQHCEGVPEPVTFVQEVSVRGPSSSAGAARPAAAEPAPSNSSSQSTASTADPGSPTMLSILAVLISVVAVIVALRRRP